MLFYLKYIHDIIVIDEYNNMYIYIYCMYVKQHSPSLLDWPILLNCMEWIGDAAAYVCKNCLMDKERPP